jgi:hypothetical protein
MRVCYNREEVGLRIRSKTKDDHLHFVMVVKESKKTKGKRSAERRTESVERKNERLRDEGTKRQ